MKSFNEYLIIKELELIIQVHKKDLTLWGLKNLKKRIIKDPDFSPGFSTLIDSRDAEIVITTEETIQYLNFVINDLKLASPRSAGLTKSPEQVVKGMIFTSMANLDASKYKIFSTIDHALSWLKISTLHTKLIESEIQKVKNNNKPMQA